MPRYVEAVQGAEIISEKMNIPLADLVDVFADIPTADVAPKSEVAREIKKFEQQVGKIYNHYVFEDTDYADDDVAIEAVINALTDVLNDIAELKKKYTVERE